MLAMDADVRLVEFNPAAERLSSYQRGDVLGQPMTEILVPERDRRILVVEDDPEAALFLVHVLANRGLLGPADRYLEKPLRVDELIATATALIGRGRPLSDDLRRGNLRAWLLKSREPGRSSPARARGSDGPWPAGWRRRAPGWWSTT
jgi:PAS domain-containing protein